jgi:hypothetical protein
MSNINSQLSENNKKAYLELIDNFWEFNDDSRAFIERRLSQDWEFPPEFKNIFSLGEYDGDQRVKWDVDNEENAASQDEGYRIFRNMFNGAIEGLRGAGVVIGYREFQDNKVKYNNNLTKIKKVFELFYKNHESIRQRDLGDISEDEIEATIIKKYERIGTVKKPKSELKMVLSFNPIDWMLCSTSSQISSCLNLENSGGGYKFMGGLPFLCGDPNRAMLYFSKGEMKKYRGMTVDQPITRSWCILNKDGTIEIIKWYANEYYSTSQIVNIAKNVPFTRYGKINKSKYEITPLYLKNDLMFTIYNDVGKYVKVEEDNKLKSFILDGDYGKGGFQLFNRQGFDLTDGSSFYYEKPNPLREKIGFRLEDFEKTGLTFNNIPHKVKCPHCHKEKIFMTISSDEDGKTGTICFDCAKEKSFYCEACKTLSFSDAIEVEFVINNGTKIVKRKICKRCSLRNRRCSCCGRFVTEDSFVQDNHGHPVCKVCINDVNKNYHECSVCGNFGKGYKIGYDYDDKTFKWFCNNHFRTIDESDFSNKFAYYNGKIYSICKVCKNNTFDASTGHCVYCDSVLKGKQFII